MPVQKKLSLFCRVNNAFNAHFEEVLGYPAPLRRILIGFQYQVAELNFRSARPGAGKGRAFLILFLAAVSIFPQKIVSLAPGITEIVFALGRGDKLVGVTKFCDYPAAAKKINKIGGFLDINMEALVALAPDIVITYPEHAGKLAFLQGRARIVTVQHGRLADLLRSILDIGRVVARRKRSRGDWWVPCEANWRLSPPGSGAERRFGPSHRGQKRR